MRRILCINPIGRDLRELQHAHDRYTHDDARCMYHTVADYTVSLDLGNTYVPLHHVIEDMIYQLEDMPIDGIFSTNDYPGQIVSSILSYELGLPGPAPDAILPLQDKYHARKLEQDVVPEATPTFETISAENPHLSYVTPPCIIKPIKGVGSMGTLYIRHEEELSLLSDVPELYLQPLHDLLHIYAEHALHENSLLVEAYAPGQQVTVDGFVHNGEVSIMGIVDCDVDPYTLKFERFVYPSELPDAVQQRMHDIVTTLVQASGLDNTHFNVECRYDEHADRIYIIEMNTRMSAQFADMYEKVDGYHPYHVAFDIASGRTPRTAYRRGTYKKAIGFSVHTDADYMTEAVPTPHEKEQLLKEIPDMRIEVEVAPGKRMSSCDDAVFIYGYMMLNIGGDSDEEIEKKFRQACNRLSFRWSR